MKRETFVTVLSVVLSFTSITLLSGQSANDAAGNSRLQQQFASLKRTMAQNKAKLKNYQWVESTELSVKGKLKKEQQNSCHYGPDGRVQKTAIGVAAPQKEPPGGLRGKIVRRKTDEMEDYMDRLKSLISRYVPPDSSRVQSAYQAGKAHLDLSSAGSTSLAFTDYYKQGDRVTIGFDSASKRITTYDVQTYLDGPKDVVTLSNQFAQLPDHTNYVQQTTLTSKSKEIEIKTTNSDYTRID